VAVGNGIKDSRYSPLQRRDEGGREGVWLLVMV
jgi:hypothetical protein